MEIFCCLEKEGEFPVSGFSLFWFANTRCERVCVSSARSGSHCLLEANRRWRWGQFSGGLHVVVIQTPPSPSLGDARGRSACLSPARAPPQDWVASGLGALRPKKTGKTQPKPKIHEMEGVLKGGWKKKKTHHFFLQKRTLHCDGGHWLFFFLMG